MSIRLKATAPGRNVLRDDFLLNGNPFKSASIYDPAKPGTYEPKMYGADRDDFLKKFFFLPLTKDGSRQVIGAVWSSKSASDWRGFGKSMLMAEESRRICHDFGASVLERLHVEDDDIVGNPMLAGYCSFDESKSVKSFAAALLDAVAFIAEQNYMGDNTTTVHEELRRRIVERLPVPVEAGQESSAIREALLTKLQSYSLNIQLNHKTLREFIALLCGAATGPLTRFVRNEIGPRIKANEGFNFVHIFNAFAELAGITHVAYFIDQIENFAKFVRKGDRNVKILRESMCQTSPTSQIASFVFQMHVTALEAIDNWWRSEDLPDLDFARPINATRIVNLKGLRTKEDAVTLTKSYLKDSRALSNREPGALHPFSVDVIEAVRKHKKGNPRDFLEMLSYLIDNAVANESRVIDMVFVEPYLNEDSTEEAEDEPEDEFENPER